MTLKGLILDFGEVLVHAQSAASVLRMAAAAGLPVEDFTRRYWAHRDAYDGGLPVADYWARVLDGVPDGKAPRAGASPFLELIEDDCASWTDYREEVWEIAKAFKAAGGRAAMLSNGVPEIICKVRAERDLSRFFDVVIVSCEVGCAKPDPRIYRLCLEQLGTPAAATMFVDDREVNLAAARDAGLQTLHFTGDASIAALRARIA
jgi:putative hydrolase of the HAD superfamily